MQSSGRCSSCSANPYSSTKTWHCSSVTDIPVLSLALLQLVNRSPTELTKKSHKNISKPAYTGCPRRKGHNFGRVFLRSNYTDITQNTYIQSSMVTEILNIEMWGLVWCLRTILCPWRHTSRIRSCIPTLSLDAAHCDLGYDQMLAVYSS